MTDLRAAVHSYRWVLLGVCFLAYTSALIGRMNVPPLASFIMSDLGLTYTEVGLLMTAYTLPVIFTAMPAGLVIDRVGTRSAMLVGLLLSGIFTMAMVFAGTFVQAFILRVLAGVGLGCIMPCVTKVILVSFPRNERATAMGINQTGVNIGGIICAATLPYLALAFDWRFCFIVTGSLAFIAIVVYMIFYREYTSSNTQSMAARLSATPELNIRKVINREISLVAAAAFFLGIIEFSLITYLVLYAVEVLLATAVIGGMLLAVAEMAGGSGKLAFGIVSDKLLKGRRKIVFLAMSISCLALSVTIGTTPPTTPLPIIGMLFTLFGLVGIGWGGLWQTFQGEFVGPEHFATISGFGWMIAISGSTVGPPIFGYIVDVTQSYIGGWFFLALCAAISAALISLVREEKRVASRQSRKKFY